MSVSLCQSNANGVRVFNKSSVSPMQWRIQGGGSRGPGPPLLGHDVGFLTLGPNMPKLDPLLDPPPLFACRPKMDRMPVDMAPGLYGPGSIWPTPGRYGPASQWIWPICDITERFALIMPKRPKYLIYSRTNINIHEHRTIDRA